MSNNEAFNAIVAMVSGQITEANAIADKILAGRIDVNKEVANRRKDPETKDEVIRKYQDQVGKLEAKIEELTTAVIAHIKDSLPKSEMSEEDYATNKAKYDELRKAVNSTKKLSHNLPGFSEDIFKDLPDLKTLGGGTAGAGTGTKRPRLSSLTINGEEVFVMKDVKDKATGEVSEVKSYTFTNAADWINKSFKGAGVKPSDLSAVAFETAKSDDLSTVDSVEFNYSATVNGETREYAFVVSAESGE